MVGVTTIALLERKTGMSRDLFSRYWRDVHGVMAARIPGFESYTQHHVTPVSNASEPFKGIAIVTFVSEADRQGLATSEMTTHSTVMSRTSSAARCCTISLLVQTQS